MPKKNSRRPKANYTATEQDFLNFCQWVLIVALTALIVAAIVTLNAAFFHLAIALGIIVGYAIYKDWFTIKSGR